MLVMGDLQLRTPAQMCELPTLREERPSLASSAPSSQDRAEAPDPVQRLLPRACSLRVVDGRKVRCQRGAGRDENLDGSAVPTDSGARP